MTAAISLSSVIVDNVDIKSHLSGLDVGCGGKNEYI